MNYLYKLIFIILLIPANFYPQVTVIDKSETDNGIVFRFSFPEEQYILEGANKNIINFASSIDESKTNLPVLPAKTVIVAIPPESKINVNFIEEKTNLINSVIPKANPQIHLRADTSLNYSDGSLDLTLSRTDFYPEEKIVIEGYTWIRNYYCAVIRINTHRYNWQKRQITQITEAKIEIKFSEEKSYIINTLPSDDFEKLLDNVIINFQEAQKFRSFPPSSMVNDSTGNWIDYTKEYVKLQIPADGIYRINFKLWNSAKC
jgi:hypothetical protein